MTQMLRDFCSTVRSNRGKALDVLLKIAETKAAMIQWTREVASVSSQSDWKNDPKYISVSLALAQVDLAEETILDAFCIQQQDGFANEVGC